MRVFRAEFEGVWLGGFAIIVAWDLIEASHRLWEMLREQGLEEQRESPTLQEVPTDKTAAIMVWNGDY